MPVPVLVIAARVGQVAVQATARVGAVAGRVAGRGAAKGAQAAGRAAGQGAKGAARGASAAGRGAAQAGRGATQTATRGATQAGRGAGQAARGGRPGTKPATGRPGGRPGSSTGPGRSGGGPQQPKKPLKKDAKGLRGKLEAAKPNVKARAKRRLERNLRDQARDQLRGGNDKNRNRDPNLLQGDGIANAAGRLAKQTPRKALRFARKRVKRLFVTQEGEKLLNKTKKTRKLVRRLILVQFLTIVLAVVGSILFILFGIAGETDPEALQRQAAAQVSTMVAIPDALIPQVAQATGIPVEALRAYSSAAAKYFVPLTMGEDRGDQLGPEPAPTPNPEPGPSPSAPSASGSPTPVVANWALLAGIGEVECNHGQSRLPGCSPRGSINGSGARGPMQFLGSTWRSSAGQYQIDVAGPAIAEGQEGSGYASDGDGDGVADPWTFVDATHGAARLLLHNGLREGDVRKAVFAYNHADWYVDMVFERARKHMDTVANLGLLTHGQVVGGYALPLDQTWYAQHEDWFTKPHHDYPAADIPVPTGTPVYAAAPGTVASAPTSGKCGTGVTINGTDGAFYIYCHGSDGGDLVQPGDTVAAGQLIMHSASTGNSTGPHLHFGIRVGGQDRCPQEFFVAIAEGRPTGPQSLASSGCSY